MVKERRENKMVQDEIKKYEPLWNKWYIEEWLGGGSFGDVYKIRREEFGKIYYSALKVISIPKDRSELMDVSMTCGSIEETKSYFDEMLKDIIQEIALMEELKGKTNIVSYEDHDIIPKNGGNDPGYDIFIRMELLEDLKRVRQNQPELFQFQTDYKEVVKIGLDMCAALELCHSHNIIHRDIKLANIFRTEDGDYKLGDFGIAKIIRESSLAMSFRGTYEFMAPEVFNKEKYGYQADIYSLGMVMYYILNGFHMAFSSGTSRMLRNEEQDEALRKRMKGEPLPILPKVSKHLNEIIEKACAFDPATRYQCIKEMENDLKGMQEEDWLVREPASFSPELDSEPVPEPVPAVLPSDPPFSKKKQKIIWITAFALAVLIVSGSLVWNFGVRKKENAVNKTALIETDMLGKTENGNGKRQEENLTNNTIQMENKPGKQQSISLKEQKKAPEIQEPFLVGKLTVGMVKVGETLKQSILSAEFQVSETDTTIVSGTLQWEDGSIVLQESGEYCWNFQPDDTERFKVIQGKTKVTVLITDTVTGTEEVKAVKDKKSLTDVDLKNCGLQDLSILKGATNLLYLELAGNNITSLEVLKDCKKLKWIDLEGNGNLSDITPLLGLKKLESVFLGNTKISSKDKKELETKGIQVVE